MTRTQAPSSSGPSAPVAHSLEYQEAIQFVQRKTGLGSYGVCPAGEGRRVLETLARALLKRVRSAGPVSRDGDLTMTFEDVFSEIVLEEFERDERVCWLVTDALVDRILRRSNRDAGTGDERSERGDQLQWARGQALEELEGGRYPVRKYRETLADGAPDAGRTFWKYYVKAVKNKTIGQFRDKRSRLFSKDKDPLDHTDEADAFRRPEPRDRRRSAERARASAQRGDARRQVLEEIRLLAQKGAFPSGGDGKAGKPDPNCVVVHKFINWLLARPEGEDLQNRQAEFARESGIPAGTVNSALKRFRHRYGYDERTSDWRLEHLYTTHGGSSS